MSTFSGKYLLSGAIYFAIPMSRKALHQTTNDPPAAHLNHANERASILIFISAQAIGSVGFALSLFAIWFGWLLPASTSTVTEPTEAKHPHSRPPPRQHRRSIPSGSSRMPAPAPIRRVSAPVNLQPILSSHADDGQDSSRHVYFMDSAVRPITRRNTMSEGSQSATQSTTPFAPGRMTTSPLASTSVLPPSDSPNEGAPDSDSFPYSSKFQKPPSRLQKLKLFNVKVTRPESHDRPGDQASITSTETNSNSSEKSVRRASGGFVASWTLSRNRIAPDVLASESASPSPSRIYFSRPRMSPSRPAPAAATGPACPSDLLLSPSFLTRKSQKRVSAPIPRTSPYGAPYFASPPILADSKYPAYLKSLPQFDDEMQTASAPTSDNDDNESKRGRTQTIRRVNLNDPRRPVPKRRAASEDWTYRQDTTS